MIFILDKKSEIKMLGLKEILCFMAEVTTVEYHYLLYIALLGCGDFLKTRYIRAFSAKFKRL